MIYAFAPKELRISLGEQYTIIRVTRVDTLSLEIYHKLLIERKEFHLSHNISLYLLKDNV